jgi:hypothetical protein
MENLLIEIYLFVCQIYGTSSTTCYQRLNNNRDPHFTDQELITIWFFAHLEGCFEKKRMHLLILKYWREWFPRLPSYQTFVLRLNRLEPTFQTLGAALSDALAEQHTPGFDHLVDSLPVMLAQHGTLTGRVSGARLPMLDIVLPRKLDFMMCACTGSHKDGRIAYRCPLKCGCVLPHITTRKPSANSDQNYRLLNYLAIRLIRHHRSSLT